MEQGLKHYVNEEKIGKAKHDRKKVCKTFTSAAAVQLVGKRFFSQLSRLLVTVETRHDNEMKRMPGGPFCTCLPQHYNVNDLRSKTNLQASNPVQLSRQPRPAWKWSKSVPSHRRSLPLPAKHRCSQEQEVLRKGKGILCKRHGLQSQNMQSFSSADLKARTPTASSSTIRTWAQAAVNFYLEIKAQSNKKAYVSRLVLPQNGYGLSTLIALPCFLLSLSLCLPVRSPMSFSVPLAVCSVHLSLSLSFLHLTPFQSKANITLICPKYWIHVVKAKGRTLLSCVVGQESSTSKYVSGSCSSSSRILISKIFCSSSCIEPGLRLCFLGWPWSGQFIDLNDGPWSVPHWLRDCSTNGMIRFLYHHETSIRLLWSRFTEHAVPPQILVFLVLQWNPFHLWL